MIEFETVGEELSDEEASALTSAREKFVDEKIGNGECREEVPYGEIFYVYVNSVMYRSCTHDPPHLSKAKET